MKPYYAFHEWGEWRIYDATGTFFCATEEQCNADTIVSMLNDPPPSMEDYMVDAGLLEENQQEWIQYAHELERILDREDIDYVSEGAIQPEEFIFPDDPWRG